MAAGLRLKELVEAQGFGPAEVARIAKKPATTVAAWLREDNKLSRAKDEHVQFVKDVLAFLRAEDREEYVWFGEWGRTGESPIPGKPDHGSSVARVLLDFLERNHIPDDERRKARKALEAILGL